MKKVLNLFKPNKKDQITTYDTILSSWLNKEQKKNEIIYKETSKEYK